jgi:hypothetical protein
VLLDVSKHGETAQAQRASQDRMEEAMRGTTAQRDAH